jgi:copper(I)-binding protein
MYITLRFIQLALITGCAVILTACSPAEEVRSPAWTQGQLVLSDAKIRAAFAQAQTGAAYVLIDNQSTFADRLVSVQVSPEVATSVELHDMMMQGDMMMMHELEAGIALPAGESVALQPGGKHIMLMGLQTELAAGKSIDMTFTFANAPAQTLSVPVVQL